MAAEQEPEHKPKPLSTTQERKLVDYLEESFLDLTRNYKKRSDPSSSLQTLPAYLTKAHTLLSMILQIPPVPPSAGLRTTFLLRLTGEVMGSIPGYRPTIQTLPQLLDWLSDLDNGWLAILRSQSWDTESRHGIEAEEGADDDALSPLTVQGSPMNQTERTRLRSLLISGTGRLEEWLVELDTTGRVPTAVLEALGLQQRFDDLFLGALNEMGPLHGVMNVPAGMEETC